MTTPGAEIARFSRFGLVGVLNNMLLYLLFVALTLFGAPPVFGAGICYLIGVLNAYWLNRRWAFSSSNSHSEDLPRFLVAYGLGLLCAVLGIAILINFFTPAIAQAFNIVITALFTYGILSVLGFGRTRRGRLS